MSQLHEQVYKFAKELSEHLIPRTTAYHEIWLDKKLVAGEALKDFEPLYGEFYLPRKVCLSEPHSCIVDLYSINTSSRLPWPFHQPMTLIYSQMTLDLSPLLTMVEIWSVLMYLWGEEWALRMETRTHIPVLGISLASVPWSKENL